MRRSLAIVILASLASLPAPTLAAPAGTLLLEDAPGDLEMTVAGSPASPNGRFAAADLVSLTVEETPQEMLFHLVAANLQAQPEAPQAESVRYDVYFTYVDRDFFLRVNRGVDFNGVYYWSNLWVYDADRGGYDSAHRDNPVTVDAAQGLMTVAVGREYILDGNATSPMPGRALTGFYARATALGLFGPGDSIGPIGPVPAVAFPDVRATDRMPDDGLGLTDLDITMGVKQTGSARLTSPVPVRSSNGEATTYVFRVDAVNLDLNETLFRLGVESVPDGWTVQLPAGRLRIAGNGTVALPIVVTTPFAHEHGTYESFLVVLQSERDPGATGRIQLGVRYTAIAQPTGHHDTVWVHSAIRESGTIGGAIEPVRGPDVVPYMNAAEDDGADVHLDIPPNYAWGGLSTSPTTRAVWEIPLSPAVAIGFDLDLNRTTPATFTFAPGQIPLYGASVSGALMLNAGRTPEGERIRVPLGGLHPTEARNVTGTGDFSVETIFVPYPGADYIAFTPENYLYLLLNLTVNRPATQWVEEAIPQPKLRGGLLTLPLQEYHDPVDLAFSSLPTIHIETMGARDRLVNPGEAVLFNLTLENDAPEAGTFQLNLTGVNLGWARVLGDAKFAVPADGNRSIVVAVTVPSDALDGEVVDLVLSAVGVDRPNSRALIRLVAQVDTDADHADEAAFIAGTEKALTKGKGAPGLALPASLLLLAALAIVARRRA